MYEIGVRRMILRELFRKELTFRPNVKIDGAKAAILTSELHHAQYTSQVLWHAECVVRVEFAVHF